MSEQMIMFSGTENEFDAKIKSLIDFGYEVKTRRDWIPLPAKKDTIVQFKLHGVISFKRMPPPELMLFAIPSGDRLKSPQVSFTYHIPAYQVPITFTCDWSHAGYYAACEIVNLVQLFCQLISKHKQDRSKQNDKLGR